MLDAPPVGRFTADRSVGLVGGAAGLAASLFVLFGPVVRYTTERSDGTTTSGTRSGIDYLVGQPQVQFELFAWPVLLGVVVVVGTVAAWHGRPRWTLGSGLAVAVFVVGMMTTGLLYAPAAVLLLGAGLLGREQG